MASYLRPRRGKAATATSQAIVLKRGEIFFEVPTGGTGTGQGKIKMGDGSRAYGPLPYFLNVDNDKVAFTDTSNTVPPPYTYQLSNIIPSNDLKTIFTNIKAILFSFNYELKNNILTTTSSRVCTSDCIINMNGGGLLKIPTSAPPNPPTNGSIWIS